MFIKFFTDDKTNKQSKEKNILYLMYFNVLIESMFKIFGWAF